MRLAGKVALAVSGLLLLTGKTEGSQRFTLEDISGWQVGQELTLEGWARWSGELMIYPTPETAPRLTEDVTCVSGTASQERVANWRHREPRHVVVTGRVVRYDGLEVSNLDYRFLHDSILSNYCHSDKVLELESVTVLNDAGERE